MSNTKKWVIAAVVLILAGGLIFAGAMMALNWDFNKLGTDKFLTNTYEVSGEFNKISIDSFTTDVEFIFTENEKCKVVCFEEEKLKHSVSVSEGTLVIKTEDFRKWYDHIGISFTVPKMTVYLPDSEYESLNLKTATGDVKLPKEFSFDKIEINGDTCDIECNASASSLIEIKTDTGDIELSNITAGEVKATVSTGDVYFNNLAVKGKITVISNTGDVSLERSDADEIYINTDTGDVKGTLLTAKVFFTETSTGDVSVPKTVTGGRCEIKTSTGDIEVKIVS